MSISLPDGLEPPGDPFDLVPPLEGFVVEDDVPG